MLNPENSLKQLRKGIDFIGVSVCCYCHDDNGRVLLTKRSLQARDEHGKWDLVGGGVEFGGTIDGTIPKEVKEEVCAEVLKREFLGYRDVHRHMNGQHTHWVALDFKVLIDPGQVKNGEPHKFDEVKWFKLNELPPETELHSQLPLFIKKYYNQLN